MERVKLHFIDDADDRGVDRPVLHSEALRASCP